MFGCSFEFLWLMLSHTHEVLEKTWVTKQGSFQARLKSTSCKQLCGRPSTPRCSKSLMLDVQCRTLDLPVVWTWWPGGGLCVRWWFTVVGLTWWTRPLTLLLGSPLSRTPQSVCGKQRRGSGIWSSYNSRERVS